MLERIGSALRIWQCFMDWRSASTITNSCTKMHPRNSYFPMITATSSLTVQIGQLGGLRWPPHPNQIKILKRNVGLQTMTSTRPFENWVKYPPPLSQGPSPLPRTLG